MRLTAGWAAHGVPRLLVRNGALTDVGQVAADLGMRNALVVTDPGVRAAGWADPVAFSLRRAGTNAAVWDHVRPGPPEEVVHRCRDRMLADEHDGLVAVGGGSCVDVAKAVSGLVAAGGRLRDHEGPGRLHRAGPPVIAVPTALCGGAEVSRHAVITGAGGHRYTVSGPPLAPRAVVADPRVFGTAPREVLVDTVADALIHAVESYLARAATPYSDIFARAAVASITRAAPRALGARPDAGTWMNELVTGCLAAGVAMAETDTGPIHALGYPLTSEFGIPHGRAGALVAGSALRALTPAAPDRCLDLLDLWAAPGGPAEPAGLAGSVERLIEGLGIRRSLAAHGVPRNRLSSLAEQAASHRPVLRNAPATLTETDLHAVYDLAWTSAGRVRL
ncbi:iron-containing alcohol dehydrogenase [Actinomadura roseirufa]|uniref:iron-containing alcohol dehydrogenase n=1 Tax=Actinomadura roseirufa TaxID=2094049 RepID=UPI00104180E2|nr:iron-containing alcohol dehydrogenase [Actinomadura roseirufa]